MGTDLVAPVVRHGVFAASHALAFTQAIDLLEQLARHLAARQGGPRTTVVGLGRGTDPQAEAMRLSASFGLAFNGSAIAALYRADALAADQRSVLQVNFFGLGGNDGPLPEAYLELVTGPLLLRDSGVADFLDIFQHRLLSYVYRAEHELRAAAPFQPPDQSAFMPAVRALLGRMGDAPVLDPLLAAYAGLVAQQRHSMAGLLALLRGVAQAPVRGREFAGRWVALPAHLQTTLGIGGRNDRLGEGAVLGGRAWDQNGAVGLTIGPLRLPAYLALLPGGTRHAALAAVCRYYLGAHVAARVCLELETLPDADEIAALGSAGCRLGYTSWLPTGALGSRRSALVGQDTVPPSARGAPTPLAAQLAWRCVSLSFLDGTDSEEGA